MSGTALVSAAALDIGHGGVFYVNDGCREGGTVTVRPAGSVAVTVIARDPPVREAAVELEWSSKVPAVMTVSAPHYANHRIAFDAVLLTVRR